MAVEITRELIARRLASAIVLAESNPLLVLGFGGVERWVAYPLLLWVIGFGGYLLGDANPPD